MAQDDFLPPARGSAAGIAMSRYPVGSPAGFKRQWSEIIRERLVFMVVTFCAQASAVYPGQQRKSGISDKDGHRKSLEAFRVRQGCNQHRAPKTIFTVLICAFRESDRTTGPLRCMAGIVN